MVSLNCDKYAEEPVFYPVQEEEENGPRYTMVAKTNMGCPATTSGNGL